jgi:cytidylate kinase
MKKIIITLDGYSACGKSTLARQLAKELNYVFIDSGAMYRAITLYFLRNQINSIDSQAVINALNNITLQFKFNNTTGQSDIYLNDENVASFIRDMQVSEKVSEVAALEQVRTFAVAQQQLMGIEKGIVMDGRDIGTTVFPNAALKIFVTADPAIRAQRRYQELHEKNPTITLKEIQANLEMRDAADSNRALSPLRKAVDAIELDNSLLTRENQLALVLQWARKAIN